MGNEITFIARLNKKRHGGGYIYYIVIPSKLAKYHGLENHVGKLVKVRINI